MPRAPLLASIRVLVLIQLAVSAALVHDYTVPVAAFCATGAGCDQVKQSSWSQIAGVPVPILGVLAFLVFFGLTLLNHERRKQLMVPVAFLGALGGLAFIAIQAFILHVFCKLCLVIDVASLLAALAAYLYLSKGQKGDDGAVSTSAWGVLGVVAFVAPFVFASMQPRPPVPAGVARHWVANKVNIVELSDFECPFCRLLHPRLTEAMTPYSERVHLTRLTVPLPSHQHARSASRAYLCARDQGKGEPMADALFEGSDLSPEGSAELAQKLGLDMAAFKKCVEDPKTDARVTQDFEQAQAIGFKGLPTVWIGDQAILGARETKDLKEAIEKAIQGGDKMPASISPVYLWIVLIGGFLAVGIAAVREKNRA